MTSDSDPLADAEPGDSTTEEAAGEPTDPTDAVDPAEYDAIVYDLDGTLVHLLVDWDAVARDVVAVFEEAGVDVDADRDLWDLLRLAPDHGIEGQVEATIADHEREGARRSERLPLADGIGKHDAPVVVCSLNAEAACRLALQTHDIEGAVDAVVGRDSVETHKPDPEPLLAALRAVDVAPERALFVGDSERDERTAERAGVAFRHVDPATDR